MVSFYQCSLPIRRASRMNNERKKQFLKRLRKTYRQIKRKLKEFGDQDLLTRAEIGRRDKLLLPISRGFRKLGISANHITCAGIIVVTIQNILMYFGHTTPALFFAVTAFASPVKRSTIVPLARIHLIPVRWGLV